MSAQGHIRPRARRRQRVQEFFLAYTRLPPNKKNRVYELCKLLEQSNDDQEQREIAMAIAEIIVPDRIGLGGEAGKVADLEEGVSKETISKVEAYRKHVGATIRRRRGELGLTQEELAAKSGLPQSHISRLEDGKHSATAKTIDRLAKALDIEPSKLDILRD